MPQKCIGLGVSPHYVNDVNKRNIMRNLEIVEDSALYCVGLGVSPHCLNCETRHENAEHNA